MRVGEARLNGTESCSRSEHAVKRIVNTVNLVVAVRLAFN
jgi:hypothetical protein